MRVTRLKVVNLRSIAEAEFRFKPGFNLIVGMNDVGKTSVLDALGVCLAAVVKHTVRRLTRVESFTVDDIRIGANALTVECDVVIGDREFRYLVHKPRRASVSHKKNAGMPREQMHGTSEREEFIGASPMRATGEESGGRPLAVLFSTQRAVPSERAPSKDAAAGGVPAAYAEAFSNRELRLGEFAAWMRVQEVLRAEKSDSGRVLEAFEEMVRRFLPGYQDLRVSGEDHLTLVIDRGGHKIPVRQLSDGERGTLALVLGLTQRLAQANPEMADPAAEAEAVVLIDEIDLHLHPKWQRMIVKNLTEAFPRCQFIATTHSPQVIGEVGHERIHIMADGEVYSPPHSFGIDSSRVLEEIMDARPRTKEVQDFLQDLSKAIGNRQHDTARSLLDRLAVLIGEDDPEVTRARTLLDFMEGDE